MFTYSLQLLLRVSLKHDLQFSCTVCIWPEHWLAIIIFVGLNSNQNENGFKFVAKLTAVSLEWAIEKKTKFTILGII